MIRYSRLTAIPTSRLIQNALLRASIVFLKLSEDQVGSFDLLLTPLVTNTTTAIFLNYSLVQSALKGVAGVAGAAPR